MPGQCRPADCRAEHFFHISVNVIGQGDDFAVGGTLDRQLFALFQQGLAVGIGLCRLHRHLGEAEEIVLKHLGLYHEVTVGVGLILKSLVCLQNKVDAGIAQVNAFAADVLAALHEALAGINELHPSAAVHGLTLGQYPDVSGNAGIVEQVGGQLHNGFHKIPVDEVAANLGGTAAGIAVNREEPF